MTVAISSDFSGSEPHFCVGVWQSSSSQPGDCGELGWRVAVAARGCPLAAPQQAAPAMPRTRESTHPTAPAEHGEGVPGGRAGAEWVAAAAPPIGSCAPPTRAGRSRSGVGRRGRAVPERRDRLLGCGGGGSGSGG